MKGSEKSNFLFFDNISVFIGKILKEKNIILKLIVKWSLNIHTENADGIGNNNKERRKKQKKKMVVRMQIEKERNTSKKRKQ